MNLTFLIYLVHNLKRIEKRLELGSDGGPMERMLGHAEDYTPFTLGISWVEGIRNGFKAPWWQSPYEVVAPSKVITPRFDQRCLSMSLVNTSSYWLPVLVGDFVFVKGWYVIQVRAEDAVRGYMLVERHQTLAESRRELYHPVFIWPRIRHEPGIGSRPGWSHLWCDRRSVGSADAQR